MSNFVDSILIRGCQMDEEKANEFKDYLLKRYQILGNYINGKNPIWELSGKKEDVKNAINDNWLLRGLNSPMDVMDKATVDFLGF